MTIERSTATWVMPHWTDDFGRSRPHVEAAVRYVFDQSPFPDERVSEDSHTWLRYSAGGARFAYLDEAWSSYRTTTDDAGSASRAREGGKADFYAAKARVDSDGFRCAIDLAVLRGAVDPSAVPDLWAAFHLRLAATLAREEQLALASEQVSAARAVSIEATDARLVALGWSGQRWAHPERNDTNLDEHR